MYMSWPFQKPGSGSVPGSVSSRQYVGRLRWPRRKQGETGRQSFSANDFCGESARQIEPSGTSGQRKLAESFELREIQRETMGTAETAQDAPLQG